MGQDRQSRAESAAAAVLGALTHLSAAVRGDQVWVLPSGDLVPERLSALIDLAVEYDSLSGELAHLEQQRTTRLQEGHEYVRYTFRDAAVMTAQLEHLESSLASAHQMYAAALERIAALHDPDSADAVDAGRRFAVSVRAIESELERQAIRVGGLLRQCTSVVESRREDAAQARRRAEDKAALADLEAPLLDLRGLAERTVRAARHARLSPGGSRADADE